MSELTYFRVGVPNDMVSDIMWNDDFEVSTEPITLNRQPMETKLLLPYVDYIICPRCKCPIFRGEHCCPDCLLPVKEKKDA